MLELYEDLEFLFTSAQHVYDALCGGNALHVDQSEYYDGWEGNPGKTLYKIAGGWAKVLEYPSDVDREPHDWVIEYDNFKDAYRSFASGISHAYIIPLEE